MLINRNIIIDSFTYNGVPKDEFCKLINRWKRLFVERYDSKKGDIIALGMHQVNNNNVACIFAAAELGLRLMILTKPISYQTIPSTKMAQLGPAHLTVHEHDLGTTDPVSIEMCRRYSKNFCWEEEIDTIIDDSDVTVDWEVYPDDPLVLTSTSGTTGKSKPVNRSHRFIFDDSMRNIKDMQFKEDDVAYHQIPMHHISGLVMDIIPSIMSVSTHYSGMISFNYEWNFVHEYIVNKKANRILAHTSNFLDRILPFIEERKDEITRPFIMSVSGFPMTEKYYDWCKRIPIEFYSFYGSAEAGGLLLHHITKDTEYQENCLGKLLSEDYPILFEEDGIYTEGPLLDGKIKLDDKLEKIGDLYFYRGRNKDDDSAILEEEIKKYLDEQVDYSYIVSKESNKRFLVMWDIDEFEIDSRVHKDRILPNIVDHTAWLKKEEFIVDTKVSNEQLLAYLDDKFASLA